MQVKFFTVSITDNEQQSDELNKFLRANKILEIDNQLVHNEKGAYWCFCIKYLEGNESNNRNLKYPEKVDYKEVLNEATFKRFSVLREIRKQIAQDEGLPAFAVFTDAELSEIAKLSNLTLQTLTTIKGIGEKKIEKFGKRFLDSFLSKNET